MIYSIFFSNYKMAESHVNVNEALLQVLHSSTEESGNHSNTSSYNEVYTYEYLYIYTIIYNTHTLYIYIYL